MTIRYYERLKLIPKATRSLSGYRLYPSSMVVRLNFIKKAKSLGFSLEEIKSLLTLYELNEKNSMHVRDSVAIKLDAVQQKIRDLKQMEQSLNKLLASCDGSLPTSCCPIIQTIFWK